jgi:uncharacterized protein DUF4864
MRQNMDPAMLRVILAVLLLMAASMTSEAGPVSDADRAEFQRIISSQIDAFRADDGPRAYSYAAPNIKRIFSSPDIFMQMVRQGYMPVYRPRSFHFGEATLDPLGRPSQRVTIVGTDGKTYEALYSMERQPDGTWRIDGCTLLEIPGVDA